jgi:hypothetical protein
MNNYLLSTLFILFSTQSNIYAQNKKSESNFSEIVRDEQGDLNHDGRVDKVIVKMDIINATRPLLLQIFFSQPNGKLKLEISSTRIIEAQYPIEKKGKFNGYQIPDFFIEDGNLIMRSEIKEGNITHEFRFKNGNFELIKVNKFTYDGLNTTIESEFNLLSGFKIDVEKSLGSEKIIRKSKKTIIIKPLPKIQDFKFTDKEKY